MLRRYSVAVLALLGFAAFSGCAGWLGSERRETNTEVTLISFGSTTGELAPCG